MQFAHPSFQQVNTLFGSGYVAEQHAEEAHHYLSGPDSGATGVALVWLAFYGIILIAALTSNIG